MSEGIASALSYLTIFIGFAATAAYAATFYLTTYNEINYGEESSYDDADLPYTLAIIECAGSAATLIFGLLAYSATRSPTKRVVLVTVLFFAVSVVMQGTFSIMRAWNLGLFGDELEKTCADTSKSGCPTTRFEAVADNPDIEFLSPSGGECQFWFWGPNMRTRYTGPSACNGYGETDGMCGPMIETYMNWQLPSSYGWRDDPQDIAAASAGTPVTMDKIHNMKYLFAQQATIGNVSIPTSELFTKQPSIAYCWYWGCSQVCTAHRFLVNRWWLLSSVSLFVLQLINMIISLILWRRASPESKTKSSLPVTNPVSSDFVVPEMGRRKRRLVQNPNGLQF